MTGNGIGMGTVLGVDADDVISYATLTTVPATGETWNWLCDFRARAFNGSNHSYLMVQRTSSNAPPWLLMVDSAGDIRLSVDFTTTDYQGEIVGSYFDDTPHRLIAQYTFGNTANVVRMWLDGVEATISSTAAEGTPAYLANGIGLGNDPQFTTKVLDGVLGQCAIWKNTVGGIGLSIIEELNNGANPLEFRDGLIFHHSGDSIANAYDTLTSTAGSVAGCGDYGSDAGFASLRGFVGFHGSAENADYLLTTSDADDDGDDEIQVPQMIAEPPPDSFAWRDNGAGISGVTTERPTLTLAVGEHQIDAVPGWTGSYYGAAEDRIFITVQDVDGNAAAVGPVKEHIQWNTHTSHTQAEIAARIALKDWTPSESSTREDDAWAIRLETGGANMIYGAYVLGAGQIGREGFGNSFHPTGAEADAFYAANVLSFLHNNAGTPLDRTGGDEYHMIPTQAWTDEAKAKIIQRAAYEAPSYSGKIPHNPTGGEYPASHVKFDNQYSDMIEYAYTGGTGASSAADIREVKHAQHWEEMYNRIFLRQLGNYFGLHQSGATVPLGLGANSIEQSFDFDEMMAYERRRCVELRFIFREAWCAVWDQTEWWSDTRMTLNMANHWELLQNGVTVNISIIIDSFDSAADDKVAFVPILNALLQHAGLLYVATRDNQNYETIWPDTRPTEYDVIMGLPVGAFNGPTSSVWDRDYERGGFVWWDNSDQSYMLYPAPDLAAVGNKSYDVSETITPFSLSASHQLGEEAFTYSISGTGDALPDGLSLNTSTGEITGTVDAAAEGTYNIVGRVDEANGGWDTVAFTITINATGGGGGGASDDETDLLLITGVID